MLLIWVSEWGFMFITRDVIGIRKYRVSKKSFSDYEHLLQKKRGKTLCSPCSFDKILWYKSVFSGKMFHIWLLKLGYMCFLFNLNHCKCKSLFWNQLMKWGWGHLVWDCVTLKIKVLQSAEMLVSLIPPTKRNIWEVSKLQSWVSLAKFYVLLTVHLDIIV
jgi:hypothetical protein